MKKKIVYFDQDGVLADFLGGLGREVSIDAEPIEMTQKGFYRNLPVMPGAREAISALLKSEKIDIYIASKPTTRNPHCASEKYAWIEEHFPELTRKVFLTCNKGLLRGDYLIDDHYKWGEVFEGEYFKFNPLTPEKSWNEVLELFKAKGLL